MADDKYNSELDNESAMDEVISKHYQVASNEQPASHLDDAILAASRKSVKSRPRPGGPFYFNWYIPVSLAAVLVLCVSIVITMQNENELMQRPAQEYYDIEYINNDEISVNETAEEQVSSATVPLMDETPPRLRQMPAPDVLEEVVVTSNDFETDLSQTPAQLTTIEAEDEAAGNRQRVLLRESVNVDPPILAREAAIRPVPVTTTDTNQPPFIFDEEEIVLIGSNQITSDDNLESIVVTGARVSRLADTSDSISPAYAAGGTNLQPGNVLQGLAGQWTGRATMNTNIQVPYDINFIIGPANCVTGRADTGVSTHTWSFCDENNLLKLEVSRNLNGSITTVEFEQSSQDEDDIAFTAGSIDDMEIILLYGETRSTLRIMHNNELQAEIRLTKVN